LFLDSHVNFEKSPCCGINDDNIYTRWGTGDIRIGELPALGSEPFARLDNLLVHDTETDKGRACFVADTPAWVDGKVMQISKVTTGQTLEQVQEHEGTFKCRDIVLETGNTIGVVDAHRFMLDSGQWIAAQNLTTSVRLKTLTGTVGIKSITTRSYTGKVYNLKVKNGEQYLVGKDGVVVRDW
jgi:hypothetical protein